MRAESITLKCPRCGVERDNPRAVHPPGRFISIHLTTSPELCDACRRGALEASILPPAGIPVFESAFVPLTRRYGPTGAVMADVQCVRIDGRLYFHPQRIAELQAAQARPPRPSARELDRWADDGGAR